MKKIFVLFAAVAALVSCTKENHVNENSVENFSVTLSATAPSCEDNASSASAQTRTTLVDGQNTKYVHWCKGDAIKVLFFPNHKHTTKFEGSNGVFKSTFETETSANASFTNDSWGWGFGSDLVSGRLKEKGIAFYPSTAVAYSNNIDEESSASVNVCELSFELPADQFAVSGNIESNLNFSYAEVGRDVFMSAIESHAAVNLEFKNACALIQLTMPASFEKEIASVTVSSNNGVALTGKGNVDMNYYKDEIASPFHVTPETSETSHTVTLVKSDASPLEAGATYYAVVWPGKHDDGLTVSFNAADGTVASKPTKPVTLTASNIKPYTFSSALVFESVTPKEYNYVYADGSLGNDVRNDIVGVVIFHGNPKTEFNDSQLPDQYCNGLAISVSSRKCAWNSSKLSSIPSSVNLSGATNAIAAYNVGGYTSTQAFGSNNYTVFDNGTSPAGTSGWYLGAANEWKYILNNKDKINELLAGVGDAINPANNAKSDAFWLPYFYSTKAAIVYISSGVPYFYYEQYYFYPTYPSYCYNVRPIFAF